MKFKPKQTGFKACLLNSWTTLPPELRRECLLWGYWHELTDSVPYSKDLVKVKVLITQSCPTLWYHGLSPTRLLYPWNSPGKNAGAGCHSFLQGIFPTKGSKPDLPHYRQILYHLSHQGSPEIYWGISFLMILYWSLEAAELLAILVLRVEIWLGDGTLNNASWSCTQKERCLNLVLCSFGETLQVGWWKWGSHYCWYPGSRRQGVLGEQDEEDG